MLKKILDYLWLIMAALAVLLIVFLFVIVVPARINAEESASEKGSFFGNAVGSCIGSFDGFTKGLAEGDEAGKKEGLSAKDTTVNVIGKVHDMGNLEVLNLSIKRSDVFSTDGGKNNSLYVRKCTASFSVDLTKAEISEDETQVFVKIPYPVLDEMNYEDSERIAHYSQNSFVGSSKDGSEAYLNAQEEIKKKIEEELSRDTELFEQAKESAIEQVGALFRDVRIDDKEVRVLFAEGNEDEAE